MRQDGRIPDSSQMPLFYWPKRDVVPVVGLEPTRQCPNLEIRKAGRDKP